ncbi:threonine--tRNA ligase [Halovenus rubra]|uniref:Threonine--tRNA ligase n=2 Tax=Halovenus rubra TaxID=869890 RepID=A0ABD5X7M0_9EURY|nr:threonine--tRNA ligase [Halovenus rubra]
MSQQASTITVVLPDGSELEVERGATVEDVAFEIGPGLGQDTIAGVVDGDLVDKATPLTEDCRIEIVTEDSAEYLDVLRHTGAHVFAQALHRHYPEAKLAIGPSTDDGFYYDISGVDLDEEDLDKIEAEMVDIVEEDYELERVERPHEEAVEQYEDNHYKQGILENEASGEETVSFYIQDDWEDLCEGPHVDSTGEIGAITLLEMSAAYWRGDEENDQLTRVYGSAFESEDDLEAFIQRRKEAEERDHRKIGQEMDLFSVPDHSPGCAHYHPNGMQIRRELEEYIRDKNEELGYDEVWTPELNKAKLWKPTGHYEAFKEEGEMFAWDQDETEYGLKPMNCANHAHIYSEGQYSYRDLPVRFSEFGTVYRNEQSGELSGLLRVRGLTQDDGHAFIRRDQIEEEITQTLKIIEEIYSLFDFEVLYKLETKGDNAVGSDDIWDEATQGLRNSLESIGLDYDVEPGEAAFYGPKIGLDARDALGREWTIGTVQLDFNIPERLDLSYVGKDNEDHQPVMVHRALLGSFERFMGVMIEHFGGDFPTWLAPEQVRILPVSDDNIGYAKRLKNADLGEFRVEIEDRSWTVGKKIQAAHDDRVPYMIIVGDDEEDEGTVSVRDRFENQQKDFSVDEFRAHLEDEVGNKRIEPDFLQ